MMINISSVSHRIIIFFLTWGGGAMGIGNIHMYDRLCSNITHKQKNNYDFNFRAIFW